MRMRRRLTASAIYGVGLIAVWYILSGKFDVVHFGTGVLASLAIAATVRTVDDGTRLRWGRVVRFVPWLLGQVIVSNLRVARAVLSPRLPIRPTLLEIPPGMAGERALALLGIAVTLTPGTLTVDVDGDRLRVHALDDRLADDVRAGEMCRRVGPLFTEREP